MYYKKMVITIFCLISLALIPSCSRHQLTSSKIVPTTLTDAEEAILDLVGLEQEFDIYDYQVGKDVRSIQIWLEAYEHGEELEDAGPFAFQQLDANKGRIAIGVDGADSLDWTIVIQHKNGRSSHSFTTDTRLEVNNDLSHGRTKLAEKTPIEIGREIVLHTAVYKKGDSIALYNPQEYIENPDLLTQYDSVYLIKCRFLEELPE